jgi:hypothetical protein
VDKNLAFLYEEILNKPLLEYVGDNKVDNLADELRRSTEVELAMFVGSVLNTQYKQFLNSYSTPQHDGFQRTISAVRDRYCVMDDQEKIDLSQKIETLWKDIMVKQYGALGADSAELVATRYAKQMISWLKRTEKDPQEMLYPHNRELAAKADPADTTVVIDVKKDAWLDGAQSAEEFTKQTGLALGQLLKNPF